MALATVEQIRERALSEKDKYRKRRMMEDMYWAVTPYNFFSSNEIPTRIRYSNKMAEEFLAKVKEQWDTHNLGKGPRPWNIARVTKNLDKTLPWIGMEYETGFNSPQSYGLGVNELWNNHENVAMDAEGYGSHYAEITFSPVTLDVFNTSEYNIDRLMAFDAENNVLLPYETRHGQWGMHVNFSTPAIRKSYDLTSAYENVLAESLRNMPMPDRIACFNRNPYGSFEARDDSADNLSWLEGKLFCTTTDPKVWAKYKAVINNMIKVVLRIESQVMEQSHLGNCITNFAELLLSDDVDSVEVEFGKCNSNGDPRDMDDEYDYDYDDDQCDCLQCRISRGEE